MSLENVTDGENFQLVAIVYQAVGFVLLLSHFSELLSSHMFTASTRNYRILSYIERNAATMGIILILIGFVFHSVAIFVD